MKFKIISIASIVIFILFAVSFTTFLPPLEQANRTVISKDSPQTAVLTTHKRGAGPGFFKRKQHVAYINDKDWVVLGPWTKDQNEWTAVQTALHNEETIEIFYAVPSNMILDSIPEGAFLSHLLFFTGKKEAQVWSSKAKKWYSKSLQLQTILQAKDQSGKAFFELEASNSWLKYVPLVFIALIPLIKRRKR